MRGWGGKRAAVARLVRPLCPLGGESLPMGAEEQARGEAGAGWGGWAHASDAGETRSAHTCAAAGASTRPARSCVRPPHPERRQVEVALQQLRDPDAGADVHQSSLESLARLAWSDDEVGAPGGTAQRRPAASARRARRGLRRLSAAHTGWRRIDSHLSHPILSPPPHTHDINRCARRWRRAAASAASWTCWRRTAATTASCATRASRSCRSSAASRRSASQTSGWPARRGAPRCACASESHALVSRVFRGPSACTRRAVHASSASCCPGLHPHAHT